MDAPPSQLHSLARILNMRKHLSAKPYHLLLTSALSLTPAIRRALCGTDDWPSFRLFLQQLSPSDRLYALNSLLYPPRLRPGYQALARLIKNGYFSLVLTTTLDSDLDLALSHEKVSIQHTLIVGRDTNEHIVRVLDNSLTSPCILKLQGSVRDGVLSDHFPDFFELNSEIARSVRHYLNQDLLIIGSLEHEHALERVMIRESKASLYSVPLSGTSQDTALYQLIHARSDNPELRIFSDISSADLFFTSLERFLKIDIYEYSQKGNLQQGTLSTLSPSEPQLFASPISQHSRVFIAYNKSDKRFLNELHIHLDQYVKSGTIEYWDDTKLFPGSQQQKEREQAFQSLNVVVLLVSAEFLADTSPLQERLFSLLPIVAQNGVRIFCVILRHCAFEDSVLASFHLINTKPLSGMNTTKRDEIWHKVAKLVRDNL